jgi:hypothetical protein
LLIALSPIKQLLPELWLTVADQIPGIMTIRNNGSLFPPRKSTHLFPGYFRVRKTLANPQLIISTLKSVMRGT